MSLINFQERKSEKAIVVGRWTLTGRKCLSVCTWLRTMGLLCPYLGTSIGIAIPILPLRFQFRFWIELPLNCRAWGLTVAIILGSGVRGPGSIGSMDEVLAKIASVSPTKPVGLLSEPADWLSINKSGYFHLHFSFKLILIFFLRSFSLQVSSVRKSECCQPL